LALAAATPLSASGMALWASDRPASAGTHRRFQVAGFQRTSTGPLSRARPPARYLLHIPITLLETLPTARARTVPSPHRPPASPEAANGGGLGRHLFLGCKPLGAGRLASRRVSIARGSKKQEAFGVSVTVLRIRVEFPAAYQASLRQTLIVHRRQIPRAAFEQRVSVRSRSVTLASRPRTVLVMRRLSSASATGRRAHSMRCPAACKPA